MFERKYSPRYSKEYKYKKSMLPTSTQWVIIFILPSVLTIYFLVTRYSDSFIATQGIDYVAVQHNVLAQLYLTGALGNIMTRFMDFAFWGVLASIGVLIFWNVSSARTAIANHNTQTDFANFNQTRSSWHKLLAVTIIVKILLVVVAFWSFIGLITRAIPQLAYGIALAVRDLTPESILAIGFGLVAIVGLETLFTVCIRTFRLTKAD